MKLMDKFNKNENNNEVVKNCPIDDDFLALIQSFKKTSKHFYNYDLSDKLLLLDKVDSLSKDP
jgi:hypothetical protein